MQTLQRKIQLWRHQTALTASLPWPSPEWWLTFFQTAVRPVLIGANFIYYLSHFFINSQVERTDSSYGFQRRGNCISERLKALQRSHCSLGRGVCWGGLEEEHDNGGNGVDTKFWSPGSFCLFVCYIIFIYKQGSGDRERNAQWVRALTTKPGKTSSFSMEWVALWPPHTCPGNTCTHTQLINQSDFVFNLEGLCVDDFVPLSCRDKRTIWHTS